MILAAEHMKEVEREFLYDNNLIKAPVLIAIATNDQTEDIMLSFILGTK